MTSIQAFLRLAQLLSHCVAFTARAGEELVNVGRSRMIPSDRVDLAHHGRPSRDCDLTLLSGRRLGSWVESTGLQHVGVTCSEVPFSWIWAHGFTQGAGL